MPATALLLVLAAALLHATWNLLLKGSGDRLVAVWAQLCLGGLVFAPFLVAGGIPGRALPYVTVSSVVEVVYFLTLTGAYRRSDLSTVYPIARGIAPPLIALAGVVFLGDLLSSWQAAAVLLVSLGVILVGMAHPDRSGRWWAIATGVLIAVYTSIDAAGVRATGESFRYTIFLTVLTAVLFTPLVLARRRPGELATAVRREGWRHLVAGAASLGAYALVLVAARSAPVGTVGAVRETSVLFGSVGGWWLLNEPIIRRRVAGALVITAGVVILALL